MKKKRDVFRDMLQKHPWGSAALWYMQRMTGHLPKPDMAFPSLCAIEISSVCNLSCIHCPPHQRGGTPPRAFSFMDVALFERIMDEIDSHGIRQIALHKDGEPLLHPHIDTLLQRVKMKNNHTVYLSTNAHPLTREMGQRLLDVRIDTVNFSIGAASEEFYERVRGSGYKRVIENIETFLELRRHSTWKPQVAAQIIRLENEPAMEQEIVQFKKFWGSREVNVDVWDMLSWGTYDIKKPRQKRYPCFSLWHSMTINSDGKVSACCVDWKQDLITGDVNKQTIQAIWLGAEQEWLRTLHQAGQESLLPLCEKCNYWSWCPKLARYPLK